MAETLVKEKVCNACGAEVRPQAVFCYNCGSAVVPDVTREENKTQKFSDEWLKDYSPGKDSEEIVSEKTETEGELIEEKRDYDTVVVEKVVEENEKRDLSKMDSAANLRRRGKSVQKKRIEIVWEEHDNAPNGWFIFFAMILTILALTIWLISTYLA